MRKWIYAISVAILFIITPFRDAVASSYSVIYTFTGGSDGDAAIGGLVLDSSGALYGLTYKTVFKLTPTDGSGWVKTTLYSFEARFHNCFPGGFAMDSSGALYGMMQFCYDHTSSLPYGEEVVYKLTPPATVQGAWTFAVLHHFRGGSDGEFPMSVMVGANNVIYGSTFSGGVDNVGTIFALTPSLVNQGSYAYRVIYRFTEGRDGDSPLFPQGTLSQDSTGTLYGTTEQGGVRKSPFGCVDGCGTVFELVPPTGTEINWHEKTIYRFSGVNGTSPYGVIADPSGALYGTTMQGGSCESSSIGCGTVFKLVPPLPGRTIWTRDISYKFEGSIRGKGPNSLTMTSAGILYGTTSGGGTSYFGNIFSLNPQTGANHVVHSFQGGTDGSYPGGLISGPDGSLYGTTTEAGYNGIYYQYGTVFKLVP
jgi:uncharacterized repeat protein (TIGR03803 family)